MWKFIDKICIIESINSSAVSILYLAAFLHFFPVPTEIYILIYTKTKASDYTPNNIKFLDVDIEAKCD